MKPHALPPLHNFFLDLFFSLLLMGKSEKNNTYKNFSAYIFLTAIKPTRFDGFSIIAAQNNRLSKGEYPLGSGFPIGASSIPVGTRFSVGKSSVLYLCFRLTPGRGWLRHLQSGQMDSRQTLPGGSRAGEFCTPMDEIRICTAGKIRLTEKGSKGISSLVSPQRNALIPPWQLQP